MGQEKTSSEDHAYQLVGWGIITDTAICIKLPLFTKGVSVMTLSFITTARDNFTINSPLLPHCPPGQLCWSWVGLAQVELAHKSYYLSRCCEVPLAYRPHFDF